MTRNTIENPRSFGLAALAGAVLATGFAGCRPPVQASDDGSKTERPQPSQESPAAPQLAASAPESAKTARFAENLVAVGFAGIGDNTCVSLLDRATGERFLASSGGPADGIRVVEIRRAGQSVLLRKGDATATVPLELRPEPAGDPGAVASTGTRGGTNTAPVFSSATDGISAKELATAPVFKSATDGMTPQEIAAAPVFQSAEDPVPKAPASPARQGADASPPAATPARVLQKPGK